MRTFALAICVLLASFSASASTDAEGDVEIDLVSFTQLGFSDDELATLQQRLGQEIRRDGAALAPRDPQLTRTCLEDPACRAEALAGRAGGLAVELTRIGPLVQVKVTVIGPDGAVLHEADQSVPADAFIDEGALLDDKAHAQLAELVSRAPAIDAVRDTASSGSSSTTAAVGEAETPDRWLPMALGLTGLGTTVVGLFAAAGFASIAASQAQVLNTATTLGTEKEAARIFGITSLVGVGVGVVVSAAGLGMAGTAIYLESQRPPDAAPAAMGEASTEPSAPSGEATADAEQTGEGDVSPEDALEMDDTAPADDASEGDASEGAASEGDAAGDDDATADTPEDAPQG